jgi:hypothetical protein
VNGSSYQQPAMLQPKHSPPEMYGHAHASNNFIKPSINMQHGTSGSVRPNTYSQHELRSIPATQPTQRTALIDRLQSCMAKLSKHSDQTDVIPGPIPRQENSHNIQTTSGVGRTKKPGTCAIEKVGARTDVTITPYSRQDHSRNAHLHPCGKHVEEHESLIADYSDRTSFIPTLKPPQEQSKNENRRPGGENVGKNESWIADHSYRNGIILTQDPPQEHLNNANLRTEGKDVARSESWIADHSDRIHFTPTQSLPLENPTPINDTSYGTRGELSHYSSVETQNLDNSATSSHAQIEWHYHQIELIQAQSTKQSLHSVTSSNANLSPTPGQPSPLIFQSKLKRSFEDTQQKHSKT